LRFLKRGSYPILRLVHTFEELKESIVKWHGKRNIYIGLRDRRKDLKRYARAEDIVGVQSICVDIDPIRPAEVPSTRDELERAIEAALEMSSWFEKEGFVKPWIGVTGNGTALYFAVPWISVTEENAFDIAYSLDNFEKFLRKEFKRLLEKLKVFIDSMYDLPRIVRVIGTLNMKGTPTKERPWRLSCWLYHGTEEKRDCALARFDFGKNLACTGSV